MTSFTALVLAGKRSAGGEGLNTATTLKAAMPLMGQPMIARVISALANSKHVSRIIVCGPAELGTWPGVTFFPPAESPARSVSAFLESQGAAGPVLITTADHALLSTEMVDHFCAQSIAQTSDLSVAMAAKDMIMAAYPGTKRTGYPFRDGTWCSCNLFGAMTGKAAALVNFWRYVEQNRKQPWRIISAFGWTTLIGMALRLWSLPLALQRAGQRFGISVSAVPMPWPEAAIDVDTLGDKALVEAILAKR